MSFVPGTPPNLSAKPRTSGSLSLWWRLLPFENRTYTGHDLPLMANTPLRALSGAFTKSSPTAPKCCFTCRARSTLPSSRAVRAL